MARSNIVWDGGGKGKRRKARIIVDLITANYGSIIAIEPHSARGRTWLARNVPDSRPGGEAVYCDHRCGMDIAIGAVRDGLILQDAETGRISNRAAVLAVLN